MSSRGAGSRMIAFGFVLVVVGAIMRFAVTVHTSGFNIHKGGDILLAVGIVALIVGLVIIFVTGRSRSTIREGVRQTPEGRERFEERDDWATR